MRQLQPSQSMHRVRLQCASRGAMCRALGCLLLALLGGAQRCPAKPIDAEADIEASTVRVKLYSYEVVAEYPHDANAFTQGLQFDDRCDNTNYSCKEVFWESTGLWGRSSVRLVSLDSGEVQQQTALEQRWFGEGLAKLGDKLYQLTWQGPNGFIYSATDLSQIGTFNTGLPDGWGLTVQNKLLVVSDGSSKLTWLDPNTWQAVRSVTVRDGAREIPYLNELEFINGEIWANVWQTECIARIDPATGGVKSWVLMHGLRSSLAERNLVPGSKMDVLNGVAYDHARKRLFVTGKLWPRIFEIVPVRAVRGQNRTRELKQKRQSCYIGG